MLNDFLQSVKTCILHTLARTCDPLKHFTPLSLWRGVWGWGFLYNDNAAKLFELCGIAISSGAGGIRTHVQTGKPYAFYTFIPAFGFRATARPGPPTGALASKISSCCRGPTRLFPIYLHRLTLRFGTTSLERCLVPSSDDGIKPVIYCTSIRQRERSCFRQLNFCSLRLKS
jgi:hypothetical protein